MFDLSRIDARFDSISFIAIPSWCLNCDDWAWRPISASGSARYSRSRGYVSATGNTSAGVPRELASPIQFIVGAFIIRGATEDLRPDAVGDLSPRIGIFPDDGSEWLCGVVPPVLGAGDGTGNWGGA